MKEPNAIQIMLKILQQSTEEDKPCSQCGKVDEVRPYGKNGALICPDCGRKDPREVDYQMAMRLFGYSEEKARDYATEKLKEKELEP